jgi:transcriptional regulator with XRE-family HTH domain
MPKKISPVAPGRVRGAWLHSGLTQLEVAQRMGVTDVAVSMWIRGIRRPAVSRIEALAGVLDTSVEYLSGADVPVDG